MSKKRKIKIYVGLPGSGKTTAALALINSEDNWVRLNKDSIREMIGVQEWSTEYEALVNSIQVTLLEKFMKEGRNIVIDNCHLSSASKDYILKRIAVYNGLKYNYDVEFQHFTDVPVEECIMRDSLRARTVGKKIIQDMYEKFLIINVD